MAPNPLASDLDHVLEYTRDSWEELRGERLFITGGTGFFGSWLLESLIWANDRLRLECDVTVLTRWPEAFRAREPQRAEHAAVTLWEGDICTFNFPPGTFSHIIHAATETNPQPTPVDPRVMFKANMEGMQRVLEFTSTCGARKLLFTSSGAVYGKQPPEMTHIPEDYAGAPETTDPATAYGQSKRGCEFLCTTGGSSSLQAKIARCFAFVGPELPLDGNYAIGNFIRDGLAGKSIYVSGDGTPYRSYLYAADLAIWLWTILFKGKHARPYNVGSDVDLTIAQLADEVLKTLSPVSRINFAKQPPPNQLAQRYVPSIERVRRELGLDVRIGLSEAIRRTARFNSQ
jgi:nucleoside-diphosphate-sugar epimerase